MRGVSVVVVGQLGGGVQEATVSWEVTSCGGRVSRGLLALTPAGERVELGIADVGQSGRRSGVITSLWAPGGGEGAGRTGSSSAGSGTRASGAAADGCSAPRCSSRGAVVGVVHGGTGPGQDFVLSGSSDVVVPVGGVLETQRHEAERALRTKI